MTSQSETPPQITGTGPAPPPVRSRTPATNAAAPRARAGRKRSEESRLAILTASFELFSEVGYGGLTIEGIADRASCGKQTIYRWWPSKGDVLLEAIATKAETHVPLADRGSYPADLGAFLVDSFALTRRSPVISGILCALMAETQLDDAFAARFRAGFIGRRREALGQILTRAAARGDLPDRLRTSTVLDLIFGLIWYRMLAVPGPFDDDLVTELLVVLT